MSEPMGTQTTEQLKIIHFGAGQGDCTLIMIRAQDDSKDKQWHTISILVDTGFACTADAYWKAIWQQIRAEGGLMLNYLVISHFDKDHFKHAARILKIIRESQSFLSDGMSGGMYDDYPWKDRLRIVDRCFAGKTSNTYNVAEKAEGKELNAYIGELNHWRPQLLPVFTGHDLLESGRTYRLPNFQFLCVAANGYIGDTFTAALSTKPGDKNDNENDVGLAFLLRFGSFRFYTGGDLHGTHDKLVKKVANSMEEPLAQYVYDTVFKNHTVESARHTCVATIHHHGSSKSTLGAFINYFNPRIAVCSGSGRTLSRNEFPTSEVIARLRNETPPNEPKVLSTEPAPAGRQRGTCTLLHTFQLKKSNGEIRPNGPCEEEPSTTAQHRKSWSPCSLRDVILHVIDEPGRSPLKSGERPRIYISKRNRDPKTFAPAPIEPYELPDFKKTDTNLVYCECDRAHENLPLPTRSRP